MKRIIVSLASLASVSISAQEKFVESEVISLIGKNGFEITNKEATFKFKPYLLLQTNVQGSYVDDEGLGLADYDNFVKTGFGVPNAIVGFAGKSFDVVTFNLALNPAKQMLSQAWFDLNVNESFRMRMGKFKTPMFRAFQVRLGEKILPNAPQSLTTAVNIPYNLNSVNPMALSGFDVGIQFHGLLGGVFNYKAGMFNGTGSKVNDATRTTSDDTGLPSWMYALRLAYAPLGAMPISTGGPLYRDDVKFEVAGASSYTIEANGESSNDLRTAVEFSLLYKALYFSAEGFWLQIDFTERQRTEPDFNFFGGYAQLGYLFASNTQPVVRFEALDRNSAEVDGLLLIPAVGVNQFLDGQNMKVQIMYQSLMKTGHSSQMEENDDDNGMPEHKVVVQVQFAF